MSKKRDANGRGLFYTRDSGGKSDQTPAQYVSWAIRRAGELSVNFAGKPDEIDNMIRTGQAVCGDIFLDYCVAGNLLRREALDQLFETVRTDSNVSHIFIPRRDRLARPDDALDGVKLENQLRSLGITLVFMDKTLAPLKINRRLDIGEQIVTLVDYDQSGRFRRDLAEKMIYAQLQLAQQGYSTGGRAPYGFQRWLVQVDGTRIRPLEDHEVVRRAGHHVVWLPGAEKTLDIIRRILSMLETIPATQVARILNAEGILSPDAGRTRKDHGVTHTVSGRWNSTTITNLARHPLVGAVVSYGRRSMGDQLRATPTGPRELEDSDRREANNKPKVVRNPEGAVTSAPGKFEPLLEPARHQNLKSILDVRGGSQRGKPRSRDPGRNPFGCRIFDVNCCWPMYRQPYGETFRYVCGQYQQSHGQECTHNHVDGLTAVRFVLCAIRQHVLWPDKLAKLRQKLLERAKDEQVTGVAQHELKAKQSELAQLQAQLVRAGRNMTLAENDDQYRSMSAVFNELTAAEKKLQQEVDSLGRAVPIANNLQDEVEAALGVLRRLEELAADDANLPAITELAKTLNIQLYLRFEPVQKKKRVENKIAGGMMSWGDVEPPIVKYQGFTGRRNNKDAAEGSESRNGRPRTGAENVVDSGWEGKSLGNVSRGDRI